MTHDELPEHTIVCSHFFKHRDCKGCYPPQYTFYEPPTGTPPPTLGRKM